MTQALRVLAPRYPRGAELAPAYVVGGLGAFWTIERVVAAVGGSA